ncbi:efflux RND transporter periplasmic adaptor subunit [Brevundimonas sp.]|uniref:efflux RND transporter periplasmic adaptor subunit n=1 Tax=Brevundimonas sp. TaxID=1871086 RepID=UPI0035B46F9B
MLTRPSRLPLRLAVLAAVLGLAACHGGQEAGTEKEGAASSQTVTVSTARTAALDRTVTASGAISAWEEVPVGAEAGGLTAVAVLADEGQYVRQGQPLVRMNDTLLRAQLTQQQASVEAAEANADREAGDLSRARELNGRGFLSQASLDLAISEERSAQAQLSQSRAALAETRARLDQAVIRAPVSGLIISRSVTRGQIVDAGVELFRLVRDGRLELDAQIPETELNLVRAGQSATVSSDQVGQAAGRVRIVTPEVDAETRLGVARIALAAPGSFRPGMFGRAEIAVGAQPAVVVPTASVLFRENRAGVYVLGAENRVRFQPVQVLARSEAETSVDGVAEGARVVVEGAGFLGEGDVVRVVQPTAAPARPAPAPAAKTAG